MSWAKVGHVIIVGITLFCLLSPPVWGDTPIGPHDHVHESENHEYLFVMLSPYQQGQAWDVRRQYAISGLYEKTDHTMPLWTVEWYSNGVEVANDGKYLVRWGPWASSSDTSFRTLAVAFYRYGRLLRAYCVRNLVKEPTKLPYSTSHYGWLARSTFDAQANRLLLETVLHEQYLFDVTTGRIIQGSAPLRWLRGQCNETFAESLTKMLFGVGLVLLFFQQLQPLLRQRLPGLRRLVH